MLSRERGARSILGVQSTALGEIQKLCAELGLDSAYDQMERLFSDKGVFDAEATPEERGKRVDELFADLHRRIYDELKRKVCLFVPAERTKYCDSEWLANHPIAAKFPSAVRELQAAGRCYAFGEATASSFHSMRALEVALVSLAAHFGVPYDHSNWHPIIVQVEAKIREVTNEPRSEQRLEDERFFGGIARHFMFLKNAWRNYVMHVRETYSDREAHQMLDHVRYLLSDMAPRLSEPGI